MEHLRYPVANDLWSPFSTFPCRSGYDRLNNSGEVHHTNYNSSKIDPANKKRTESVNGKNNYEFIGKHENFYGDGNSYFKDRAHYPSNQEWRGYPNFYDTVPLAILGTKQFTESFNDEIDKRQKIDDYQPRKLIKSLFSKGELNSESKVDKFCETNFCDKHLVMQYIDHLKILEQKRKKRDEKRKKELFIENEKEFQDFDWMDLFVRGKIKCLSVNTLNKYLQHFDLKTVFKYTKDNKVNFIRAHLAKNMSNYKSNRQNRVERNMEEGKEESSTKSEVENQKTENSSCDKNEED